MRNLSILVVLFLIVGVTITGAYSETTTSLIEKFYKDGTIKAKISESETTDENGILRSHSTRVERYNKDGMARIIIGQIRQYDEDGNLFSRGTSKRTNKYNKNGTFREKKETVKYYNGEGTMTMSSERIISFDREGNFLSNTFIVKRYDENGKLTSCLGDVSLPGLAFPGYHLVYDVNEDGKIVYTHVYDPDGTEIADLSGEGFIAPKRIVREATGQPHGKAALLQEPLKRKGLESKIWKQAGDPLFAGQIAGGEPAGAKPPKK